MEKLGWIYRAWRYRRRLEKQEITCPLRLLHQGDGAAGAGALKGAYPCWMLRPGGAE